LPCYRHFIKGFITRNDAPNECNASFIVLSKKLWLLKLAEYVVMLPLYSSQMWPVTRRS
jgi:hypothetical protein